MSISKNNIWPKVSVITACYNSKKTIEQTVDSVIRQTYDNIEYIIIDGSSKDGTIDILNKYKGDIDIIISEPDRGIYDAFNKGILASTGDIIFFLNSDDYFYDEKVVEDVACIYRNRSDINVVYGNVLIVDEAAGYKHANGRFTSISDLSQGQMIPHQGVFVRRHLFDKLGLFSVSYRICSDFDFIIKCFKDDFEKIQYFDRIIAVFREGGISSKPENHMLKKMEFSYIIHKHFDILNLQNELLKSSVYGLYKAWLELLLLQNKGITHLLHEHDVKTAAIFGTMKLALLLLTDMKKENISVTMFIDNNINMQGQFIEGIPVVSPQIAAREDYGIDCIIVSVESEKDIEIIKDLRELFRAEVPVVSWKNLAKGFFYEA